MRTMAKITKKGAKERIEMLRKELEVHNHNYYVLNSPTVTDFEFDMMMQELMGLENMFPEFKSADSPSQKVGSDLETNSSSMEFAQINHKYPMLSLGNTYNKEELYDFNDRIAKSIQSQYTFSCELKFDGTAICLTYKNGELVRALTRGDGTKGDDVSRNVLNIKSIPQKLSGSGWPDEFEIRGEIFMPFEAFDRLNREREENEEAPFANPRNAASGSLKLLNPQEMKERGLDCVLYHFITDDNPFKTHIDAIAAAASWGLPTSEYSRKAYSIEDAIKYIEYWDDKRKELPFATDGIVIKINEFDIQRQLGFTAKSPRWATAYKFKPEQACTPLLSIDYQVGRTGAITPVANLEPVQLSGTVVKRASLHNKDQMDLLDIHIGDYVYVEKGGEIIPKITSVESSKRPLNAMRPEFPTVCPDCGAFLVRDEAQAKHYCPNSDGCPTQIKGKFVHFGSRKAMDILLGDATVDALYQKGYIHTLDDLYKLSKEQLLTLEGWKDKSAENLLESLDKSKSVPFERVLFALGIRHIGETTAKMLANHFKSIDALAEATREALLEIDEIGDIMADELLSYFHDESHLKIIRNLKSSGLRMSIDENESGMISDTLQGQSIVISGVFSISREELKKIVEAHGGKNIGSVNQKTSFIIAGDNPGPEKIKKAEKFGIRIISEEEFYQLLKI